MPLSAEEFDFVRAFVQKRSAIVLEKEKAYLAEARLALVAGKPGRRGSPASMVTTP